MKTHPPLWEMTDPETVRVTSVVDYPIQEWLSLSAEVLSQMPPSLVKQVFETISLSYTATPRFGPPDDSS